MNLCLDAAAQSCSTAISSSLPITSVATVTTFAGSGAAGSANGTGTAASFNTATGVARDAAGNIYVADLYNHLIRKITPAGVVSTFAGSGAAGNVNGTGTAASFNSPIAVTTDNSGNVFVADLGNNIIRMITPAGVVSTLAGSGIDGNTNGTGTAASFRDPFGLATDLAGNVYVADRGNNLIRKITPAGVVTTFAGSGVAGNANGTGTAASFNNPTGIDIDPSGNMYIADFGNNLIRIITPAGVVTTMAGSGSSGFANGTGTAASFNGPFGVATGPAGLVFVADRGNNVIRRITAAGVVTTLAGSGVSGNANGTGTSASFNFPVALTTDATGNIFVADQNNYLIRRIVTNETVKTCSGTPVTLTANGGVSYSWSGPQVISNGVSFIATLSGVYTVTVTDAVGCTVSDNITVDISLSTVSPASGSPNVCINTSLTNITHTTSGSTGIGTATQLPAGVTATWASNTITISGTPTAAGIFNYSIPLIDGCGIVQATGTISVTAANTVAAASVTPTLCVNTALTPITHATTGATGIGAATGLPTGVTAAWAGNTITISGTPSVSGTFNYSIPLTGGCGLVNATGTIFVNPANIIVLSTASAPNVQTLCINTAISNITYNTAGATGVAFTGLPAGVTGSWASNLATISGTPTVAGVFNYTATLTGGCGTATGTITVVSVAPAVGSSRVCVNTALTSLTHATVSATGIGTPTGLPAGVTAAWASNTITLSGTPTIVGAYNYSIPVNGGCTASGTIAVDANTAGITLGDAPAIAVGTPTVNLPFSNATGFSNYNITWGAAAVAANFVNVTNALMPAGPSLPIALPASGPVSGAIYSGTFSILSGCTATVTNYTFNVFFTGNNVLDNLGLTAARPSAAAYSVRRLSSTYAGPVMRIRRSSNNELRDVYFDGTGVLSSNSRVSNAGGGEATATTLQTWINTWTAGNKGTVAMWYDQSGQWRNISAAIANQPDIIQSGALLPSPGGRARMGFNGSTFLTNSNFVPTTQPVSLSSVWQFTNTERELCGWGNNTGGGRLGAWIQNINGTTARFGMESAGTYMSGPAINTSTWYVTNQVVSSNQLNSLTQRVNGEAQTITGTNQTLNIPSSGSEFAVGTIPMARTANFVGSMHELVLFQSALTSPERVTMECNQSSFYSIALRTPSITLSGNPNPISVGTTSVNLPYSNADGDQYSITWSAAAAAVGFADVTNAALTPGSITIAVPGSGPVAGSFYTGTLRVKFACSALSSIDYPITVFFIGNNNVLDNLGLTSSSLSAAAYGLRKLSSAYNGPALRIRRSSDNELRDVYFDGTNVLSLNSPVSASGGGGATVTTLGGWIGSNSGTVAIWYDQSGQWRNAEQTLVANQPRIINAGVIETQNGKPAIFLNGTSSFLVQSSLSVSNPYSMNTVASRTASNGAIQRLINLSSTGNNFGYLGASAGNYATFTGNGSTWSDANANAPAIPVGSAASILTMTANSGAGGLLPYINGIAQTAKNGTATASTGFLIGAPFNGNNLTELWTGYISDFEIFPAVLSQAARTAMECNQILFYNVNTNNFTVGATTPVTVGTTSVGLPFTNAAGITNYSITWAANAISAGFSNVTNAVLPASPIPVALPASGPVAGTYYTGFVTVLNSCTGLSYSVPFSVFFIGSNNILDIVGLDASSLSAVAFGLRKLSSTYGGPALRLMRSSDGELRDVYFDGTGALSLSSQVSAAGGGGPTATTLSAWIGSNSGTVSVWYDQSGLWRNAVQSTVAGQPRLVNAGAIELQNGKPTLVFSGAQTFQSAVTSTQCAGSGQNFTGNFVFQNSTAASCLLNSTNINIQAPWSDGQTRFEIPNRINTALTWTDYSIGTFRRSGSQADVWKNGSNSLTSSTMSGTISGTAPLWIGSNGTNFMNGKLGELAIFPIGLSTAARTALECNQSAYYSLSTIAPSLTLGQTTPVSLGATTTNLPATDIVGATHYSIVWNATAVSAGFNNVTNALFSNPIPIAVPATGPVAGQMYSGTLRILNNCSGLSTDYVFNVYIRGNNVLDNLGLTAATPSSAAFGLRRLSSTYPGPALRIRRSNDNQQRDVYFDGSGVLSLNSQVSAAGGGEATATTLTAWIGTNSGTVAVWYDQSGQWRNALQSLVANQPRVINAGVIETQNGKPAIFLNGTNSYMVESSLSVSNPYSMNTVASRTAAWGGSSGGYQRLIHLGSTGDGFGFLGANAGNYATFTGAGNGGGTWNDVAANSPATAIGSASSILTMTAATGAGGLLPYINGSAQAAKRGTAATSTGFTIGATYDGTNTAQLWTGYISDFEIFPAVLTSPARTALECNQSTYYSISLGGASIALGAATPIPAGTTTANLPYSSANASQYSIAWNTEAISAGFVNVASTSLPAGSIPVPVPAVGPVAGQSYTGVLTVSNGGCAVGSASYPFVIFITGNNVLDNLGLTVATPSAVAYSLRRLSSAYTGPALQIRKSSDGQLRDVYFNSGGVIALNSVVSGPGGGVATATTLGSWIGSSSGTVAIWYDQSGQWRNISAATANQPTIIQSGNLMVNGAGQPMVAFNGNNFFTNSTSYVPTTQPISLSAVWRFTSLPAIGCELCGWGNNGGNGNRLAAWISTTNSSQGTFGVENGGSGRLGTTVVNANTWYVTSQVVSNNQMTSLTQRLNGSAETSFTGSGTLNNPTSGIQFAVGTIPGALGAHMLTGSIQELVLFPSALSTTERVTMECNQSNFYTIPLAAGPGITLGAITPIPVGTTTAGLPYTNSTATNYSISWNAAATAAGFQPVSNTLIPPGSIPVPVPAAGPVAGQSYTGILTVSTGCGTANYPFTIFISGNNVLDNVNLTGANFSSVAYGLRKLSSAYNGPAMQIRRSSDGELRDVYFNASGILTLSSPVSTAGGGAATATTLGSWMGANTGTVAIWYDQSGQWRNAVQPVAANQPRLINAGVLETQSGVPTLTFTGSSFLTHTAFPTAGFTGFSANVVSRWTTMGSNIGSSQALLDNNYTATQGFVIQDRPDLANRPVSFEIKAPGFSIPVNDNQQTGNGTYRILTFTANNTAVSGFRDGNPMTPAAINNTNYSLQNRFVIGAWFNGGSASRFTTGNIPEVIVFPSALSASDRVALECNQRVYYNVSLPIVTSPSINPTVCVNTAMTNITHTTLGTSGIGTPTGLPAGVTAVWAGNIITISGTPTVSGTFNYSIPLTEGCGFVNATGTIVVAPANTWGAPSSTPTVCINTTLTSITHTTVGATGIGTATGLPAGVSAAWASNTITISGAATAAGDYNYSIPLTGGCGSVSATGTITVTNTGTVNTTGAASTSPTLCMNTPLTSITYSTTGATGIGVATGLPPGVSAAWSSNLITVGGTPTADGTYNYSIPLTGGCGNISATGSITANPINTASAASATPSICINTAMAAITHNTTGTQGIGIATGLPAGVTASWASNRITISGTPTVAGTFNYSIPLIAIPIIGSCGEVNATGTITVNDKTVSPASSTPTVCINTALTNITHTSTNATAIGAATGLPAGVTAAWAGNMITISGTPTASGTFNYSIPLTGGCGSPLSATGTITVRVANTAAVASSTPTLCINSPLTAITHATSGATGIGAATGLPAGVTAAWASNTITISGTPTASGTFNYSIPLTGGCGTVNATGRITVNINTAGTPSSNPTLCVNTPLPNIIRTTTGATGIGGASNLPAGVTAVFNALTNVLTLSGTPTASGTFNYSIPLTGGCGAVNATGTITVNPAAIPAVVLGSNLTANICAGTSVTFTATATNGGASPTFNFRINGSTVQNTGSNTYVTNSLTNGQVVDVLVTSNATCATPATANSSVITIAIAPPNMWRGISSNWNDLQNWCGGIPAVTATVTIPAGAAFYPVINSGTIQVNNLSIASGASLTVGSGELSIGGTLTNNGTLDATNGTVAFNGTSPQTLSANMFLNNTVKNLRISNPGVTLASAGGNLNLTGTLSFGTTNARLTTNDNLTLKSTAAGTARVAEGPSAGNYIFGTVNFERFIPARRAWRMISFPFTATGAPTINATFQEGQGGFASNNPNPGYGTHITGGTVANGFDQNPAVNPSMKELSGNDWVGITNTSQPVTNQRGYFIFVRGSRAINLSLGAGAVPDNTVLRGRGNIRQGTQSISLDGSGWRLVGNPFASPINLSAVAITNSALINNNFKFWDPKLGGSNNVGGYVTASWNGSGYDYAPVAVSNISEFAQSASAFFVDSRAVGNLTINEAHKSSGGNDNVFRPTAAQPKMHINLHSVNADATTPVVDGAMVGYGENFSNSVDQFDASRLSSGVEGISILRDSVQLTIERRQPFTERDTIFLKMSNMRNRRYQLEFIPSAFDTTFLSAWLEDAATSSITPLSTGVNTFYDFSISSGYNPNRFRIVFKKTQPVVVPVKFTTIRADRQNKDVAVVWKVENQVNVSHYEVEKSADGSAFNKVGAVAATGGVNASATYNWLDLNALSGMNYYRIKMIEVDGRYSYSPVARVSFNAQSGITIYPNPVTNNTYQLKMTGQPEGEYQLTTYSSNGQRVCSNKVQYNGADAIKKVVLQSKLPQGLYKVEIRKPGGGITAINVMVE